MSQPVIHFEIMGRSPASLRTFYGNVFGWEFETQDTGNDFVGDYGLVNPTLTNGGLGIPGGIGGGPDFQDQIIFYIGVPDVEAALQAAEAEGGKRVKGPFTTPDGNLTVAHLADPEGNVVGLASVG
jgi:predicted enzyme related to lactoylglutathione lyase